MSRPWFVRVKARPLAETGWAECVKCGWAEAANVEFLEAMADEHWRRAHAGESGG